MKSNVLVLTLQIRMGLLNALTVLFQIVFKLYFLEPVYLLVSGLTRSTMCYAFVMLYHIVVKINLLFSMHMAKRTISRI